MIAGGEQREEKDIEHILQTIYINNTNRPSGQEETAL
jgi:hypothetical protein